MSNELNIPLATPGIAQRMWALVRGKLTPLFYAGSSVATAMAQLISGFVIVKWIAPEELGMWQTVRTAQIYAFLLLLGINNGLGRELPYFLGKGDEAFASRLANTTFFCVTMANVLVIACGIVCAIMFAHHGMEFVCSIAAITAMIVLGFYQHIFHLTFRSKDSFKKLTNIQMIEAGLSVLTVPMVYFFGYYGMLGRLLVMAVVISILLYIHLPIRMRLRMDWQALKSLMKTGLPIFGLDYFKNSCATLDRWVLYNVGGFKTVGIYALAGIVTQTLGTLPTALSNYTYPRMSYKFGQTRDGKELWRFGIRFVLLATAIAIVSTVAAWFALPYLVPIFAPKYIEGLGAARITLISTSFAGFMLIVDALWSMKIWRLMVGYQVVSAVLFALGPLLGVVFIGRTVEGVAWGAVVGSVLRSLIALVMTYYGTHRGSDPKQSTVEQVNLKDA